MTFREYIELLIPPPGMFLVFEDPPSPPAPKVETGNFLDASTDRDRAEKVLEVYRSSKNNSKQLLREARILMEHSYFARAVSLTISAYEELGKSQIAADYYSGVIPESVYLLSFKAHKKTSYAGRHAAIGHDKNVKHGLYISDEIAKGLERIRQDSLYVAEDNSPLDRFTAADAEFLLERVKTHLDYIDHAEELNGRIGSKGLFK